MSVMLVILYLLTAVLLHYNSISVDSAHSIFDSDLSCATSPPPAYPQDLFLVTLRVCARGKSNCTEFIILQGGKLTWQQSVEEMEKNGYLAPGRQVVFIVHGYGQNELVANWMYCVGDTIIGVEDSTTIAVSWTVGDATTYQGAAANTRVVGNVMADLAKGILNTATFGGDRSALYVYCIGHSLGSHVCGQAGRAFGAFDRVTGLDPAGPGFDTCPSWSDLKLNTSSARCVDTIHTEGGGQSCPGDFAPFYGSLKTFGHVDFFPNGGNASQPKCGYPHCSHQKPIDYYLRSVRNPESDSASTAHGPCSDPLSLPKSCASQQNEVQQQMGYYSSCHRGSSTTVQPGIFYLTADLAQDTCYYFVQTPFATFPPCQWNGAPVDLSSPLQLG